MWPAVCCGCGGFNSNLEHWTYAWWKETGWRCMGPSVIRKKSLSIHAHLCPDCLERARGETRGPFLTSWALFVILLSVAISITAIYRFDPVVPFVAFVTLVSIPILVIWVYTEHVLNPFLYYMGIKNYTNRIKMIFRSPIFAARFWLHNPSLPIEVRTEYTGHKDILDQEKCCMSFCFVGLLTPMAIMYILGMLFGF